MIETANCNGCGGDFEYEKIRPQQTRKLCDECRAKNRAASSSASKVKRRVDGIKKERGRPEGGGMNMTQADIAKKLRISKSTVEETERRVLAKIRNNPELQELWDIVKEEGFPLSAALFPETDDGQRLLDYQLALVEFWETHDKISDSGSRREAAQCLKEIEKLQVKIAKTLMKLDVSHDHSQ